jgi:1-phosphatidylinositol-4-phosphate 5-kinase
MQILSSDADFLAKCAIIDYSLLLGEIEDDPDELRQRMD